MINKMNWKNVVIFLPELAVFLLCFLSEGSYQAGGKILYGKLNYA
jgi:hypothetical protein